MVRNSFVAISDFHGVSWPVDKIVNHYLDEYDKIFILGDAMDRGPDGVNNILNVMALQEAYPNRIFYLPGNHDQFLYNYAVYGDMNAMMNMQYNGGEATLKSLENLKSNPELYNKLINWLGSQPLQRTHEFRGKKYAFAHAFFDYNLYRDSSLFSLRDISANQRDKYIDILWYRAKDGSYDSRSVPPAYYEEVIGHTPSSRRVGINLNLTNSHGEVVKVHCVDDGTFSNGTMLKFDGASGPIRTEAFFHKDTSPSDVSEENRALFENFICDNLVRFNNVYQFANYIEKMMAGQIPSMLIGTYKNRKLLDCYADALSEYSARERQVSSFNELIVDYISDVVYDEICKSNRARFPEDYLSQTVAAFGTQHYNYISNRFGARDMAVRVGFDNLNKVPGRRGFYNNTDCINSIVATADSGGKSY